MDQFPVPGTTPREHSLRPGTGTGYRTAGRIIFIDNGGNIKFCIRPYQKVSNFTFVSLCRPVLFISIQHNVITSV